MPRRLIGAVVVWTVIGLAGPARGASVSLALRAGFQAPMSAEFSDIYRGGIVYGGQLDVRLAKSLSVWAGADYFAKAGELTFTGEETRIRIIPLTAGLRVCLGSASLRPYLAAGVGSFSYKEESVLGTVSGSVFGLLGEAGLRIRVAKSLSLDVYGRYSSAKTKAEEPDILAGELGGFQGGLGLVIGF